MKKIVVLWMIATVSLFANDMKFYNPSFDCSKIHEGSIEYKICTDDKLSQLDREMSNLYNDAIVVDKDIKEAQLDWLTQRNQCSDISCIAKSYQKRSKLLQQKIDLYSKDLNTAYTKAEKIYAQTHNVYKTIPILENANIRNIIEKRPSFISKEQYKAYMLTYAKYYINTVEDTVHGRNLLYAQRILTHLTTIFPKNKELYLMLGRAYMELFAHSARARFISSFIRWDSSDAWRKMPYLAKQAFLQYMKLCKAENVQPELTKEEDSIVKRNRLFIEYYHSSFSGKAMPYMPAYTETYKKGLQNVCRDFIAMLNTMPDDNLTACSRYVNKKNSAFEYVKAEDVPQKYKKYFSSKEYVSWHLFKYKGVYFVDEYDALILGDSFVNFMRDGARSHVSMSIDTCDYLPVDTRLKDQYKDEGSVKSISDSRCEMIRYYRQTYKIIK